MIYVKTENGATKMTNQEYIEYFTKDMSEEQKQAWLIANGMGEQNA